MRIMTEKNIATKAVKPKSTIVFGIAPLHNSELGYNAFGKFICDFNARILLLSMPIRTVLFPTRLGEHPPPKRSSKFALKPLN